MGTLTQQETRVPKVWELVRLGDVCDSPSYGASARAQPFDPDLPRYVRITDIDDKGRLNGNDLRSAEPSRVQGYEIAPGDIVFARSGSVGRTYLYRSEDGPCVCRRSAISVRLSVKGKCHLGGLSC